MVGADPKAALRIRGHTTTPRSTLRAFGISSSMTGNPSARLQHFRDSLVNVSRGTLLGLIAVALTTLVVLPLIYEPETLRYLTRNERIEIMTVFSELEALHAKNDIHSAWRLMSERYRTAHTIADFRSDFDGMWIISSPTVHICESRIKGTISPGLWSGGAQLAVILERGEWKIDGIVGWSWD